MFSGRSLTVSRREVLAGGLSTLAVGVTGAAAQSPNITFWTLPMGDMLAYKDLFNELVHRFRDETGIGVEVQLINASGMFSTWLTVAQGGAAPDCADMYWLHSFAGIGGGRFGPMPITNYLNEWPTLKSDFYEAALKDVFWNGEFYGIPWRVDIRPLAYRTDCFAEARIASPPSTWEEIVEQGKALTIRDSRGDVKRWGFTPGINNPAQVLYPYYWQAGGEFLSQDGKTATIDNDAMRAALKFLQDLVHVHKITSPDIFEKSADPVTDFVTRTVAMNGSFNSATASQLQREYPELNGKWAFALPAKGPQDRSAFMGGGYWGVLYGSKNVKASIDWIKFLSRAENMQLLSEKTATASPRRSVMSSPAWSDQPWKQVLAETLDHGHTSQQPTSVWASLASTGPGAVLYDLVYSTVIGGGNIDAAVRQGQLRMQAELDRAIGR